jgi:predicted enzyme related to lactoylglutathione lyase
MGLTLVKLRLIFMLWQIALSTDNVYKSAEAIKLFGGKITREAGPLPGINTKITACLDPDGWKSVWPLILLALI